MKMNILKYLGLAALIAFGANVQATNDEVSVKIGDKVSLGNFPDAFKGDTEGAEITFLKDVDTGVMGYACSVGKTIDLNGHTYSTSSTIPFNCSGGEWVFKDSKDGKGISLTIAGTTMIQLQNAKVTVENGKYSVGAGNKDFLFSVFFPKKVNYTRDTELVITGGTFVGNLVYFDSSRLYTYEIYEEDEKESYCNQAIHISGGTFSVEPNDAWIVSGYKKVLDAGTGYWTVVPSAPSAVAKIGTIEYPTLSEAFDAAKSGETIVILNGTHDCTAEAAFAKLGAKTIVLKGESQAGTILDMGNGNKTGVETTPGTNLTLEDMTLKFDHSGDQSPMYQHTFYHPASQTFRNVTIVGQIDIMDDTLFDTCTFTGAVNAKDEYLLWCYGCEAELVNCTFAGTGTKAPIKLYNEGAQCGLNVADTSFAKFGEKGCAIYSSNDYPNNNVYEITVGENVTVPSEVKLIRSSSTGLTVINPKKDADGKYTAGTFESERKSAEEIIEVAKKYAGEGFAPAVDPQTGKVVVEEETAANVCEIVESGIPYASIADAIEAIGATESKTGTIKMVANETMPGNKGVVVPGGYDVTLDLNGFRICNDANEADYSTTVEIAANAKLTVKDTSEGANGVIINAVADGTNGDWGSTPRKNWASNTVVNHGTLILESGNIVNTTGGISYCVDNVSNVSACKFVMNGGKLHNNYGDQAVRVYANSGASIDQKLENRFEMHGGEIVTGGFWVQMVGAIGGDFDAAKNWATVLIDGGTVNGFIDVGNQGTCDVEIGGNAVINASEMRFRSLGGADKFLKFTGGKISIPGFDDQTAADYYPAVVSGGVFTDAAKAGLESCVAEGHAFVENTDSETSAAYPWMIGEVASYVAAVISSDGATTNKFATFGEAIDAVQADEAILMLADVTLDKVVDIPADKSLTLDLNGKKISNAATGFDWTMKNVPTGAPARTMVILRGVMTVRDTSAEADGSIWTDNYAYGTTKAVLVANNGNLTLESGTIHGEYAGIYAVGDTGLAPSGQNITPTLTLNGGVVSGQYGACAKGETALIVVNDGAKLLATDGFALGTNGTQDWYNGGNCKLVVNGGWIESTQGHAIYNPAECIFDVKGGTIKGYGAAVAVKGGRVTISGDAKLIATGPAADPAAVFSNSSSTGDALYVEDTYGNHKPIVVVTGGSFMSANNKAARYFTNKADGAEDHGSLALSGGIYSDKPLDDIIAEGYVCVDNTDEATKAAYPYMVGLKPYVPEEGDKPVVIEVSVDEEGGVPEMAPITVAEEWVDKKVVGTGDGGKVTSDDVMKALEKVEDNGLKGWQNFVLGIDETEGKAPLSPNSGAPEDKQNVIITTFAKVALPPIDTGVEVEFVLLEGTPKLNADGVIVDYEWKESQRLDKPVFPVEVATLKPESYWKIVTHFTAKKVVVTEESGESAE